METRLNVSAFVFVVNVKQTKDNRCSKPLSAHHFNKLSSLRGNTMITNNSNSALALDSATVDIRGHVIFSGNTGYRGGAVSMYGTSRFVLYKKSKLVFEENTCEERGGAMYVAAPGPIHVNFKAIGSNLHYCFFSYEEPGVDYDKWQTEIVFRGNRGPGAETGMSLYATTLVNCRRVGEKRDNNTVLEWNIVHFLDSAGNASTLQREVATDPVDIRFNRADWNVAPGQVTTNNVLCGKDILRVLIG